MDWLREAILAWSDSDSFRVVAPVVVGVFFGGPLTIAKMAIAREDILADIRRALQLAGISEKAAAADRGVDQSVVSRQLSGEKTLPVTAMCDWSEDFWYWLAVRVAMRVRPPAEVQAGAHLVGLHQVNEVPK